MTNRLKGFQRRSLFVYDDSYKLSIEQRVKEANEILDTLWGEPNMKTSFTYEQAAWELYRRRRLGITKVGNKWFKTMKKKSGKRKGY